MIATLATHPTADLVAEALHLQWAQAQRHLEASEARWQAWLDVPAFARQRWPNNEASLCAEYRKAVHERDWQQRRAWAWVVREVVTD